MSADSGRAEATHNPINAAQPHSTNDPHPNGVTHNQQGEQQSGNPPPAPRVMPVYLPPKAIKSHRLHHERRLSIPQPPGAQSGSDSEKPAGRVRHLPPCPCERRLKYPQHRVVPAQSGDGHVSNSTRDKASRVPPAGPRDEIKEVCQHVYLQFSVNFPIAEQNIHLVNR